MKLPLREGTVDLLFSAANNLGLEPRWIVEDGLFAIQTKYGERYINRSRSTLNSHSSSSLVKDKFLTRLILGRNGFSNIPFINTESHQEALDFLNLHGTIIVKPVKGEGAQDINIVSDPILLKKFNLGNYILEKYIVGKELRYLVLNDKVIAVHESEYGTSVAEDRHLERISYAGDAWDEELVNNSLEIASLFDLNFSAIDYLVDDSGKSYVLEVNTSPGLKWFHSPSLGPSVDVAQLFLKAMIYRQQRESQLAAPYNPDA